MPACLLACLCSPHHIHALTLPIELSPAVWNSDFRHDVRFASLFASSWHLAPLGQSGGFNLSVWAYFILLLLSAISFMVQRSALRTWRFPIWLVFALLGLWQARLVPFFAVVAGPIAALNFREGFPDLSGIRRGRAGVILAGLTLIALTWPGWLQGFQRSDRPLAWTIPPDPSLQHAAQTLTQWRKQGLLPAEVRTFAMHPDVAQYCEWFCPGEKIFLDTRLTLFQAAIPEFERLCLALNPSLQRQGSGAMPSPADAEGILSTYKIGCLLLYDPDLRVLAPALHRINQSTHEWDLLAIAGRVVFAGYKQAETRRCPHFDPERMAFAPEEPDKHASASLSVPLTQREAGGIIICSVRADRPGRQIQLPFTCISSRTMLSANCNDSASGCWRYSAGLVGLPASSATMSALSSASHLDLPARICFSRTCWNVPRHFLY